VAANDDSATLQYPGGELDLDIVHATDGSVPTSPILGGTIQYMVKIE